jgi:hypothetical protein
VQPFEFIGSSAGIVIFSAVLGMDEILATHFAHLFIRDPIVIFQETLLAPPDGLADHFEVRLSTEPSAFVFY